MFLDLRLSPSIGSTHIKKLFKTLSKYLIILDFLLNLKDVYFFDEVK